MIKNVFIGIFIFILGINICFTQNRNATFQVDAYTPSKNFMTIAQREELLKKNQEALKNVKDSTILSLISLNLAELYFQEEDYENSLQYGLNAAKTALNRENDTLEIKAYLQIIEVYLTLKDADGAWKFLEKTQAFFRNMENKITLIQAYLLFAIFYMEINEYDAATSYINLAFNEAKQTNNRYWQARVALQSGTLANAQLKWQEALPKLQRAYQQFAQDSLSKPFVKTALALAHTYQGLENFEEAEKYLWRIYPIAQKFKLNAVLMQVYEMLAYGAEKQAQTDSALVYYKTFKLYQDSIFASQRHQHIAHIQSLYDLEEKDEALKSQTQVAEEQILIRNLSIFFLGLVLFLAYLLYRNNLQKQQANALLEKQNHEIEVQKREILRQKESVETRTRLLGIKNVQIEKRNKNIIDSLNYAQRIQQAMLPSLTHIFKLLPETFVFFKPRDIVSGDFYWIAERNHKIILVVADCTGHGVPGAIMSVIGSNLLHETVVVRGMTEADQILNELHKGIRRVLKQDETKNRDGMDLAVCAIDSFPKEYAELLGQKYLKFAGAHNPMIYFQGEEAQMLKGDKYAIGGYLSNETQTFKQYSIPIKETTTFYVFSDGYQDQFGKGERKLGKKRLLELLQKIHTEPMETQRQVLDQYIEDWKQGHKQMDDMLIIGVRLQP